MQHNSCMGFSLSSPIKIPIDKRLSAAVMAVMQTQSQYQNIISVKEEQKLCIVPRHFQTEIGVPSQYNPAEVVIHISLAPKLIFRRAKIDFQANLNLGFQILFFNPIQSQNINNQIIACKMGKGEIIFHKGNLGCHAFSIQYLVNNIWQIAKLQQKIFPERFGSQKESL